MKRRRLTQPAPLLRLAIALAVGIVVGQHLAWPLWATLALLALAVGVAWRVGRWPYAQTTLIVICFVLVGMARLQMSSHESRGEQRMGPVRTWFMEKREALLGHYRQAGGTDDDAYAVVAAMALGDKQALTRELRETYSITGASHVLALSGLHLGIIYMLVSWLVAGRRRFWLSQCVIILCLWAFAFLTGLSQSVVRSATMLSVYALFAIGERGRASVNVLSFAAIVLLLIDARSLMNVGFQMSFLAVLSILLFMPLFNRVVPTGLFLRYAWLKPVYALLTVSVAAQIGVAPLIAFYFHRFSTWFLLTNVIVIPIATVVLYGALIALAVPPLMPVLMWVVSGLNEVLAVLSRLPLASIEGLHPTVVQVVLVYFSILCLYLFLQRLLFSSGVRG